MSGVELAEAGGRAAQGFLRSIRQRGQKVAQHFGRRYHMTSTLTRVPIIVTVP